MNIRYKRPDKKNALSIINSAKEDINYTLTLELNEKSSSTIVRNIYECFRMLGDAILVNKGIASKDHLEPINELLNLKINTTKPLGVIANLRQLRHNINYYGYKPNMIEAKETVDIAKIFFEPIYNYIKDEIEK